MATPKRELAGTGPGESHSYHAALDRYLKMVIVLCKLCYGHCAQASLKTENYGELALS